MRSNISLGGYVMQQPTTTEEPRLDISVDNETMLQAQANLARQGLTMSEYLEIVIYKAAENSVRVTNKN